ncbi:MAG TPA: DUF4272 domain-containing protein [Candidatus Binatus sp.]|uniref:DUF4272 domain-containing protein n=1 Tax=Candidatus Binatus sp. TaxID=2811406 RepID=UPI002F4011A7
MESPPNATQVAGRLLALRCVVTHAIGTPLLSELEDRTEAERLELANARDSQSKRFWDSVNSSPIFPYLSLWEREFATKTMLTMSLQQHLDGMWRLEAAQVLMWALRLVAQLPEPDAQSEIDLPKLEILKRPTSFLDSAALRIQSEIARARNLAELWHWRSRTEELIREGRPFPAGEAMHQQGLRSYQDIVRRAAIAAHESGDIHFLVGDDFGVKGKSYAELSPGEWSEVRSISVERHFALNWLCGYSPNNEWDQTPTDT